MAVRTWETLKVRYCDHAGTKVCLEADVVYPSEWLPDQAPRIMAHRCSNAINCNLDQQPSCVWAGTNPTFDPYLENI